MKNKHEGQCFDEYLTEERLEYDLLLESLIEEYCLFMTHKQDKDETFCNILNILRVFSPIE